MSSIISIIVPVFNTEKYLQKTLNSVLEQTENNWELIIVDDGSTDNSPLICDEFAKRDSRIKVFHKENGGLSDARNFGMQKTTGEYIAFLDSDDYIADNMIKVINRAIKNGNPDLIEFGWKYDSFGEISKNNSHSHPKEIVLDRVYIYDNIIPQLINIKQRDSKFIYDFSWNKVFKKEIIESNNVLFDSGRKKWEDRLFLLNYLRFCNSIYFADESLYYYVNVPDSLSRRFDPQIFNSILFNYRCYNEWYGKEFSFNSNYSLKYWGEIINNQIITLFGLLFDGELGEKQIKELLNQIISDDQVIFWFKQENDIPSKYKQAFLTNSIDDAYNAYYYQIKRDVKSNNRKRRINGIKSFIKKMIK